MGDTISKAASDVGSAVGNALLAPFKSVLNRSCKDVCSGTWDIMCFIEHLCILDLVRLLMVFSVCYITLVFCYCLFKLGVCQCIVKSLCKMGCATCEAYWYAMEYVCCFCWYKIRNTKRVYRGRRCQRGSFRDIEMGYDTSSDGSRVNRYHGSSLHKKTKSQKSRVRSTSSYRRRGPRRVSVHGRGRSSRARRNQRRHLRMTSLRNRRKKKLLF